MRRADRLFDIIQALRAAAEPMTAQALSERLEVNIRTIYRDIATLQARRVPIEGAAGIGYVLRRGFDLPPLMFTADEIEAITVGARMVRRLRDTGLQRAAENVLSKVATVLPEALRAGIATPPHLVSIGSAKEARGIDPAELRRAIRENRKLRIRYEDQEGRRSRRIIWPLGMAYYVDAAVVGAWCEKRRDYRHFRVERILASAMLEEVFPTDGGKLLEGWLALQSGADFPP